MRFESGIAQLEHGEADLYFTYVSHTGAIKLTCCVLEHHEVKIKQYDIRGYCLHYIRNQSNLKSEFLIVEFFWFRSSLAYVQYAAFLAFGTTIYPGVFTEATSQ